VGVSRWQQKQAMVRDMYARNNSTPDMNHEQKVMYAPRPRLTEHLPAALSCAMCGDRVMIEAVSSRRSVCARNNPKP